MRDKVEHVLLYGAYMFTCLEDRGWGFAISLCMQLLGGMQLVSIEQLAEGIAQMVFSGAVGKAVDSRSERKWGMIYCVLGNNFSIIASCGLFALCLNMDRTTWVYTVCLLIGMVFCSAYRVFVTAEKNLSSRDWILVLVEHDKEKSLARTNAVLTSLDQLANVISPLLLGALLSFVSLKTACIALAGCSIISLLGKSVLLSTLYSNNHRLRFKASQFAASSSQSSSDEVTTSFFTRTFSGIATYYAQSVFPAALGMALLFMTVLGFDGLAIGYGESVGLPENVLGFFRSFGSAAGVAGAIMYAVCERRWGVRRTGVIGMTAQEVCLLLAIISIWLPGSPWHPTAFFSTLTWSSWSRAFLASFSPSIGNSTATNTVTDPSAINWDTFTTSDGTSLVSIFAFLIGIATSRFGLWMADLAITHIMQLHTPETQRNTVFGVHNAICQTFSVAKDLLVIVLPSSTTFGICIMISFGFVCAGFLAYIYYILKTSNREQDFSAKKSIEQGNDKEHYHVTKLDSIDID